MPKIYSTAAVIIPIYQHKLSEYEKISLERCLSVLNKHKIIVIAPESLVIDRLNFRFKEIKVERFANKHFRSLHSYNKLMLSRLFYERFKEYTYVLIHQLDSLVVADKLSEWCQKGYDYIGAPWFVGFERGNSDKLLGVGNGGFSLRKIETFLKVLSSREVNNHGNEIDLLNVGYGLKNIILLKQLLSVKKHFKKINSLRLFLFFYSSYMTHYEDIFWSVYSRFFIKDFKIPTVEEALQFAFEVKPRYCYELNNYNYPFGCHAWFKHDKDFWLDLLNNEKTN